MLRGLSAAASGMYAQQRKTDLITNNLANMNTPGYKESQSAMRAFPEMLLQKVGGMETPNIPTEVGSINTGVYMQETMPRYVQGDLYQTNQNTDLALTNGPNGTVFFTVEDQDQIKYTRNGRLVLNEEGLLTTTDGFPILDRQGNQITLESDQFTVTSDGAIMENDNQVAQLGIAIAADPLGLIQEGNSLLRIEEGAEELPFADQEPFTVTQGFYERSNVDPSRAMTEMLSAYRSFEANQKIVQAYDRSLDKAVNEVGKVNG
ncbi:flagellar hook-basal body protein [Lederbergia galactosidilytica]|uniref:Flagellar basal body rod protein FlgC n=1 Tax=Lederbergia galactosidilytica TaxID=217031 RepID=A0A0Q9XK50_9BACI|nr:flagellar hook-basal body protein [Lederbergia galactosidilytica]KRG08747.1 flagellar basal body rod protein FlgC [Lederbergia galactosidilytica]KRG15825.1 flagellar basal body rod protein FlgC [Virgibacillus soli]MBP1915515.1 flagellar basal-body rod protein FlgG [Lederbergia galactosidilytica]OAK67567.1 flagellar basal body rod protein FlgC [Lederbergia galactosidilytica]